MFMKNELHVISAYHTFNVISNKWIYIDKELLMKNSGAVRYINDYKFVLPLIFTIYL